jgi:DNA-directed RNA polymerase specialized sigma24 family protein
MYTHLSYDETELLQLSAQGEEQAFIRLLQMHKHKVYSFVATLTGFEPLTEKLLRQLIQQLWQQREALVQVEDFDGYLFETLSVLILPGLKKAHDKSSADEKEQIERLIQKRFTDNDTPEEKDRLHVYLQATGHAQSIHTALAPVWSHYTATTFMGEPLWQNLIAEIPDEENPLARTRKSNSGKSGLFGWLGRR